EVGRLSGLLAIGLELGGRDLDQLNGVATALPVGHLFLFPEQPLLVGAARIVLHDALERGVILGRFNLGEIWNGHCYVSPETLDEFGRLSHELPARSCPRTPRHDIGYESRLIQM